MCVLVIKGWIATVSLVAIASRLRYNEKIAVEDKYKYPCYEAGAGVRMYGQTSALILPDFPSQESTAVPLD